MPHLLSVASANATNQLYSLRSIVLAAFFAVFVTKLEEVSGAAEWFRA